MCYAIGKIISNTNSCKSRKTAWSFTVSTCNYFITMLKLSETPSDSRVLLNGSKIYSCETFFSPTLKTFGVLNLRYQ